MKLGDLVYYIDANKRTVDEGVLVTHTISQSAYDVYLVVDKNKIRHSVDVNECFDNKDDALKMLPVVLEVKDSMEAIQKEATSKIDALREKLIGKPKFERIVNEYLK